MYTQNGTYLGSADALLDAPYRSMVAKDGRSYGSSIFARYLEDKVAAPRNPTDGAYTIIRKTWERYRTNNGGDVLTAIDQMLRNQYQTNLADRFPEFAWNNYFLNAGTYTRWIDLAYTAVDNLPQNEFRNGREWRLLRNILKIADDQAGTFRIREPVGQSAVYGPRGVDTVDHLGTAYIEFTPDNSTPGAGSDLSLTIRIRNGIYLNPANYPRVSIIAIPRDTFTLVPHPPNDFAQPTADITDLIYNRTVPAFNNLDRVIVIISNPNTISNFDNISYRYDARRAP